MLTLNMAVETLMMQNGREDVQKVIEVSDTMDIKES